MTPSSRVRPCVAVHENDQENSHVHEVITFFLIIRSSDILFQRNEKLIPIGACIQLAKVTMAHGIQLDKSDFLAFTPY